MGHFFDQLAKKVPRGREKVKLPEAAWSAIFLPQTAKNDEKRQKRPKTVPHSGIGPKSEKPKNRRFLGLREKAFFALPRNKSQKVAEAARCRRHLFAPWCRGLGPKVTKNGRKGQDIRPKNVLTFQNIFEPKNAELPQKIGPQNLPLFSAKTRPQKCKNRLKNRPIFGPIFGPARRADPRASIDFGPKKAPKKPQKMAIFWPEVAVCNNKLLKQLQTSCAVETRKK